MLMSLDKHNSRSELMVEQLVGTHVSFWEHLKKTTSPLFELLEASDNIVHLFAGQKNVCFIELREKGIVIHFKTGKNEVIKAIVGTSFISVEQARINLEREIGAKSMETISAQTEAL